MSSVLSKTWLTTSVYMTQELKLWLWSMVLWMKVRTKKTHLMKLTRRISKEDKLIKIWKESRLRKKFAGYLWTLYLTAKTIVLKFTFKMSLVLTLAGLVGASSVAILQTSIAKILNIQYVPKSARRNTWLKQTRWTVQPMITYQVSIN